MVSKEALEQRLHAAIRSGDQVEKRTLRSILSAWKLAEVDRGEALDEPGTLAVILMEAKTRREAIADAEKADRADIIEASQAELKLLETFLPQPLGEAELEKLVRDAIAEVGADGAEQMGQVMKVLMPRMQGRADGKQVSQVVRNLLG